MKHCNSLQTFAQRTREILEHLELYRYIVMNSSFSLFQGELFPSFQSYLPVYHHSILLYQVKICCFGIKLSQQNIISEICFFSSNFSWHFRKEQTFKLDYYILLSFLDSLGLRFGLILTFERFIRSLVHCVYVTFRQSYHLETNHSVLICFRNQLVNFVPFCVSYSHLDCSHFAQINCLPE